MLLSVFMALAVTDANAGDSCQILFNKQIIFKGGVDRQDAVAYFKARQFKNTDLINIKFYSDNANKGWRRTFYIDDESNNNIKKIEMDKQSGSVTFSASVLAAGKEKKQAFSVYTTSLPTDKAMAARIRVRRMFICKIEWN